MEGKGRITGHTGLLALIGSPVGHSGSPAMYNYSFEKLGLDYAYVAFDIKVEEVKAALDAMRLFHMRGCNVTMPCKTEAAKYMDELSPAARIIGAVNTIVNEDGKLIGHMTDGEGFVGNLRDHGIEIKGKKITVAGGGGAARYSVRWTGQEKSAFSISKMTSSKEHWKQQRRLEKKCRALW